MLTNAELVELHKVVRRLPPDWRPPGHRERKRVRIPAIYGPRMVISEVEQRAMAICTQAVITETRVPRDDLFAKSSDRNGPRARRNSSARGLAMYLCRRVTGFPLAKIGRFFNRHHSTVIHAINEVKWELTISPTLGAQVERLMVEAAR